MKLTGQVAIVTGAGMGIGRATALALALEGADIALWDLNRNAAESVAREVEGVGRNAVVIECDVSRWDQVDSAAKSTLERYSRVDILVNNAGVTDPALFENTTETLWDREMAINLKGTFLCCKRIVPEFMAQRHGKIVNVSSLVAFVATPYLSAYAASKGGIVAFSRVLAVELAKYDINVNVICPGYTDTPTNEHVKSTTPELVRDRSKKIPLGRINRPDDVAHAIVFLVVPDSRNITGHSIPIDGGALAMHSAYVAEDEP